MSCRHKDIQTNITKHIYTHIHLHPRCLDIWAPTLAALVTDLVEQRVEVCLNPLVHLWLGDGAVFCEQVAVIAYRACLQAQLQHNAFSTIRVVN